MSNRYKVFIVFLYLVCSVFFLVLTMLESSFLFLALSLLVVIHLFYKFFKGDWGLYQYVLIFIPAIILSPIIRFPGLVWAFKLDDFWFAFGLVVFVVKLVFIKDFKIKIPSYANLFLIFMLWISVTILLSVFREPELYSHRDWTEIYKNVKLLVFILIGVNIKLDKRKLTKIINTFLYSLSVSALFGVAQYFNLLNVNEWLSPYYTLESNFRSLIVSSRVTATFGNPNVFGSALLIGIAISFAKMLYEFEKKHLLMLLLFLVSLTMSLSRTSFIVCALMLLLILCSVFIRSNRKLPALLTVFSSPILIILVLKLVPDSLFRRLGEFRDLETAGGYQVRLAMWKNIYQSRTHDNLFAGTGPTSRLHIEFDNEWLLLLTHYGVIGVILFLTMFTVIFIKLGKASNYGFHNIAMRSLLLAFIVYMIFLPIFKSLQVMPIIILLIGLTLNNGVIDETPKHNEKADKKYPLRSIGLNPHSEQTTHQ